MELNDFTTLEQSFRHLPSLEECRRSHQDGQSRDPFRDWPKAEQTLRKEITSWDQLESVLKSLEPSLEDKKLEALEKFFGSVEEDYFFATLNQIRLLALESRQLFPEGVPLLTPESKSRIVFLTKTQIGSLLSSSFFCLMDSSPSRKPLEQRFPNINFERLFTADKPNPSHVTLKVQKLKAIFNYFSRIARQRPQHVVTFERRAIDTKHVDWASSEHVLTRVRARTGLIESGGHVGLSEVDFANRLIGGGVLASGAVQEEIRFLVSPELIVSRLLCQSLRDNESLLMNGFEDFNRFEGYSRDLKFKGNHVDNRPCDSWGRRLSHVIAIDAFNFRLVKKVKQYERLMIERELNKAFVGFETELPVKSGVASGKWGCGAFHGDPELKTVIQIMAASEAERDIVFFTFDDQMFSEELNHFVNELKEKNVKIGTLYRILCQFSDLKNSKRGKNENVFNFIIKNINN